MIGELCDAKHMKQLITGDRGDTIDEMLEVEQYLPKDVHFTQNIVDPSVTLSNAIVTNAFSAQDIVEAFDAYVRDSIDGFIVRPFNKLVRGT